MTDIATDSLLSVEGLRVDYRQRGLRRGSHRAVDDVSFAIAPHETLGLVGESGSGKSTIGRAVLGLVRPSAGHIRLNGREITGRGRSAGQRREIAKDLQVVFQDPYTSLNPSRTIGRTLTEPLETQGRLSAAEALGEVERLLASVGLPVDTSGRYPHAFSGGQRQRIAIARALSTTPRLVICDEALSALDLVTQGQVLGLLARLQRELGVAFLFIAHNLPVVHHISHRVVVLYQGRVMEQGPASLVNDDPLHPYTRALLAAVPVPDPPRQRERRRLRAETVAASTATAQQPSGDGCPFVPRCPFAADVCRTARPADVRVGERTVACHMFDAASAHPGRTADGVLGPPRPRQ
ncbi:oligopeptide/dipeptide ABC transporter ATP-binding protein [Streptomyces sp. NPDC048254]|uniref:oligopeptide/dipeptide ABC transporter ATP-binding protein n=1 Tax=Streptomyces sp. NPDC048254 TaxID=3365525 RepID=UPI00371A5858